MKSKKLTIRQRGIYLLPNLLTTAAIFSGFYGVVSAIHGEFAAAGAAIFVAQILDGMDGRVARITNTQSEFGAQYDSMADVTSFAIAPAIIMYLWAFSELGHLGLFAAFDEGAFRYFALLLSIMTGLLMVSNFPYYSFKDIDIKSRVSFVVTIGVMLVVGIIFAEPAIMLFLMAMCYAVSGPIVAFLARQKRRATKKS
jgi:CDP-diacylglycerol--serine O-phosphatidyltransferase